MSQVPSQFNFGRVIAGWGWLLNRDGARLLPLLLVWAIADFALYSVDWMTGIRTGEGLDLLSTTYLLDPLFIGAFYLVALSDDRLAHSSALSMAWRRYVSLLLVSILVSIGCGIGFLLLILPGIALAVLWSLAVPVLLAENRSPTEAMAASFNYVRGRFWPILGIYFIYALGVVAFYGVLVIMGLTSETGEISFGLAIDAFSEAITAIVGIYLSAAIYRELAYAGRHDVGVFD